MQHTFFSLLTSKKQRRLRNIEVSLNKEFMAVAAPWFDGQAEALKAKTITIIK